MITAVEKDEFLYHQIAEKLEKQIEQGVLKAGDKLLSVRHLSKEQGISISTAYLSYVQLENKGLIEARPKSGYYVKFTPRTCLKISRIETTQADIKKISIDEMITMIYKNLSVESVIKFSLAAPAVEFLPAAKLNKAMHEALRTSKYSCLNYENLQGNVLLRKQIARLAFNWGGEITEDDVVTTQGCMEAIVFCLKAITQPGDTVAIDAPNYFGIFHAMQSLGLKVLEIPNHPDTGLDMEYLKKAIDKVKIKACVFVPNFNNPIGSLMPDENKKKLVRLLADKDIPLIEDDIYGELYFGKQRPKTCKSFDKTGNVLLCSSVSKSLAPGYRVGWVIPGKYKEKLIRIKLIHTCSNATPTQTAIGIFFEKGRYELHLRNLRKALYTNYLHYLRAITSYFPADIKVSQPQGGYVLWLELNKNVNAFELYQKAIEQNISITPGQIFSADGRFTNYIRIGFGILYNDEVERSLKTLGNLAKKLS
ncbi:MAG: PLP-dependent aminotransferase family protein [Chitinophagales bacterium]|nr:PLP-dependent aminotransferase family protein [Chitinophagales bacterium]